MQQISCDGEYPSPTMSLLKLKMRKMFYWYHILLSPIRGSAPGKRLYLSSQTEIEKQHKTEGGGGGGGQIRDLKQHKTDQGWVGGWGLDQRLTKPARPAHQRPIKDRTALFIWSFILFCLDFCFSTELAVKEFVELAKCYKMKNTNDGVFCLHMRKNQNIRRGM